MRPGVRDRRRNQQGTVAVVMAIVTCFVVIPLAAVAVDIGMQRVVRRDMQALADVMALDMSRQLTGKALSTYSTQKKAELQEALEDSRDRNTTTLGYGTAGETADVSYELGTVDSTRYGQSDYFTVATAPGTVPNAIKVTATATVDFRLAGALPGGGFGTGSATRTAIGTGATQACMMMDSYAAALSSGDSAVLGPLNRILGTSIDTQVLSSSGILNAQLDVLKFLGILQTNLGVGGFDEVLAADVSAAQVVAAQVAALNAQGLSAAAQALQSQIGLHIPPGSQVNVGELLGVTQGIGSGLGATVNALDLAAAAVQLANGNAPVSLSVTSNSITGLAVQATIGSRPTRVCLGEGKKTMGQTSLSATAQLDKSGSLAGNIVNLVNGLTGMLGNTLCTVTGVIFGGTCYGLPQLSAINLNASVSLARASGTVTGVTCEDETYLSVLEESSLAPATITLSFNITVRKTVYNTILLGGGIKSQTDLVSTVTTQFTTDPSPGSKAVADKLYVPDHYDTGKAGPSGDLSVGNLTATTTTSGDTTLLSMLVGLVGSVTSNLVNPLLGGSGAVTVLLDSLTSALKNAVGLTVAGSTYTPLRTPGCGVPKLVG